MRGRCVMRRFILRNPDIRARAAEFVAGLPVPRSDNDAPPWEVLVQPYRRRRSMAQNRLYWMWVDAIRLHILDSTGKRFNKDELHEWLSSEFLPTKVVEIGGKAHPVRTSTANLNTAEMRDYLESIEHWAGSDLQCMLPHPDDLWAEAMGVSA